LTQICLMMTKNERFAAQSMLLFCFVSVVLNIFLIPIFGASGAAFATSIAAFFCALLQAWYIKKTLNISTFIGKFSLNANR
jgi:Na+-driven multidrug efflux pump